jgi:preprotein translocase subunit SecY
MTACFCAGAAIVMWMAEKINEFGIGNGISIILFANIIARLPDVFLNFFYSLVGKWKFFGDPVGGVIGDIVNNGANQTTIINLIINIAWILIVTALLVGIVWLVVWFNDSERRIPVQYAKRVVGRKMYGGQSSNLPLKLNMAGVMPVIFANSIVSIPSTLNMMFPNVDWIGQLATGYFSYTKPLYVLISIILLFAFAYFYIMISFNPVEVANNIRNNGGAVPGIRPGKPTSDYIKKILNRITFIGAIFLCVVSEVPKLIVSLFSTVYDLYIATGSSNQILKAITDFYNGTISSTATIPASQSFMTVAFAGTSILIVVGVILETVRELEAQLTMRNYKGFLD